MSMNKLLIKTAIAETCINILFNTLIRNFSTITPDIRFREGDIEVCCGVYFFTTLDGIEYVYQAETGLWVTTEDDFDAFRDDSLLYCAEQAQLNLDIMNDIAHKPADEFIGSFS